MLAKAPLCIALPRGAAVGCVCEGSSYDLRLPRGTEVDCACEGSSLPWAAARLGAVFLRGWLVGSPGHFALEKGAYVSTWHVGSASS